MPLALRRNSLASIASSRRLEALAQRRLAQPQLLGGTSEISLLRDDGKIFEVPQLHDMTPIHDPMNSGHCQRQNGSSRSPLMRLPLGGRTSDTWEEHGYETLSEDGSRLQKPVIICLMMVSPASLQCRRCPQ